MHRSTLLLAATASLITASPLLGPPTLPVPTALGPVTLSDSLPANAVQSLVSWLSDTTANPVAPTSNQNGQTPTISPPPTGLPSIVTPTASLSPLSLTVAGPHTVVSPSWIVQPAGATPADVPSRAIPTLTPVGVDASQVGFVSVAAPSTSWPSLSISPSVPPSISAPLASGPSLDVPSADIPPITVLPSLPSSTLPSGWAPPIQVITEGPEPILIVPMAYTSQGVPQFSVSKLTLSSVSLSTPSLPSISQPGGGTSSVANAVETVTIIPIPFTGVPIVSVITHGFSTFLQPGIGILTVSPTGVLSGSVLSLGTPSVGSSSPAQPSVSFAGVSTTISTPMSAPVSSIAASTDLIPPAGLPPITSLQSRQPSLSVLTPSIRVTSASTSSVGQPPFTASPLSNNTVDTGNATASTTALPSSILQLPSLSNIPTTLLTLFPTLSQVPTTLPLIPPSVTPTSADLSALLNNVTAASQVLAILSSNLQSNLNDFTPDSILVSSLVGFVTSLFGSPRFNHSNNGFADGGSLSNVQPATLLANVKTAIQVVQVIIDILRSDSALETVAIPGLGVSVGGQEELVGKLGGIVLELLAG